MCAAVAACLGACVCAPPPISTSAAHRRGAVITISLISYSRLTFASPAAPSPHIYHIHLIFRNKCSRKRIMHLPYAPFITDTFTWGCRVGGWGGFGAVRCCCSHFVETGRSRGGGGGGGGGVVFFFALALSVSDDKWPDLSVSAVTFIKGIFWPSSGESSTTPQYPQHVSIKSNLRHTETLWRTHPR